MKLPVIFTLLFIAGSAVTIVTLNEFYGLTATTEESETTTVVIPDEKVSMQISLDQLIEILDVQPEGDIREELLEVLESWKPKLEELGIDVPAPYDENQITFSDLQET